jgi:hypothetical protein
MGDTGMSAELVQAKLTSAVNKMLQDFRTKQNTDCCRAYLELGKALHSLADSWTGGHAVRLGDGTIRWLQDYNRQSAHFHEAQDALADANPSNYANSVAQNVLLIQQAMGNGPIDSSAFFQLAPNAQVGTPDGTGKIGFRQSFLHGFPGEQ